MDGYLADSGSGGRPVSYGTITTWFCYYRQWLRWASRWLQHYCHVVLLLPTVAQVGIQMATALLPRGSAITNSGSGGHPVGYSTIAMWFCYYRQWLRWASRWLQHYYHVVLLLPTVAQVGIQMATALLPRGSAITDSGSGGYPDGYSTIATWFCYYQQWLRWASRWLQHYCHVVLLLPTVAQVGIQMATALLPRGSAITDSGSGGHPDGYSTIAMWFCYYQQWPRWASRWLQHYCHVVLLLPTVAQVGIQMATALLPRGSPLTDSGSGGHPDGYSTITTWFCYYRQWLRWASSWLQHYCHVVLLLPTVAQVGIQMATALLPRGSAITNSGSGGHPDGYSTIAMWFSSYRQWLRWASRWLQHYYHVVPLLPTVAQVGIQMATALLPRGSAITNSGSGGHPDGYSTITSWFCYYKQWLRWASRWLQHYCHVVLLLPTVAQVGIQMATALLPCGSAITNSGSGGHTDGYSTIAMWFCYYRQWLRWAYRWLQHYCHVVLLLPTVAQVGIQMATALLPCGSAITNSGSGGHTDGYSTIAMWFCYYRQWLRWVSRWLQHYYHVVPLLPTVAQVGIQMATALLPRGSAITNSGSGGHPDGYSTIATWFCYYRQWPRWASRWLQHYCHVVLLLPTVAQVGIQILPCGSAITEHYGHALLPCGSAITNSGSGGHPDGYSTIAMWFCYYRQWLRWASGWLQHYCHVVLLLPTVAQVGIQMATALLPCGSAITNSGSGGHPDGYSTITSWFCYYQQWLRWASRWLQHYYHMVPLLLTVAPAITVQLSCGSTLADSEVLKDTHVIPM